MIRPTLQEEAALLVEMTRETGHFKPMEIQALCEVFADYYDFNREIGHCCVTLEGQGQLQGFAYYAPAAMTEGTWHLYWIVVRKETQARGAGTELLRHVEADIRQQQGRQLLIETSSLPHYDLTRKFYVKNEYAPHAVVKDFYAVGDDLIIFRKELT